MTSHLNPGGTSPFGPLPPGPTAAPEPPPAAAPEESPAEEKPAKKAAKPIHLRDEYGRADKDNNGKLSKSEMKLLDPANKLKTYDGDKDGEVSLGEYRAGQRKLNAFEHLDRDGDDQLSTEELGKLRRFTSEEDNAFDADGDGAISREEFHKGRIRDRRANREAIREDRYEELSAKELKKLAEDERYDGDGDGKVTVEEFKEGRKQAWRDGREAKMDHLFKEAGAKDGSLSVKDAKPYASYDADGDGQISKDEFKDGFMADRKAFWEQTHGPGEIGKALKSRLGLDEHGFGLNRIEKPEPEEKAEAADEKVIKTEAGPMVKRDGHLISVKIADKFDAMAKAAKEDGITLQINSGYRTRAEQAALYEKYGPGRAAPPGSSNHEHGEAIDFLNSPGAYDWLARNASKYGLHNLPSEPWHYSLDGR